MRPDNRRIVEELYERLERQSPSTDQRERLVSLFRDSFEWEGDSFTSEDERMIGSFRDGLIGIRKLQDHFGERLTDVLLRARENGDV